MGSGEIKPKIKSHPTKSCYHHYYNFRSLEALSLTMRNTTEIRYKNSYC